MIEKDSRRNKETCGIEFCIENDYLNEYYCLVWIVFPGRPELKEKLKREGMWPPQVRKFYERYSPKNYTFESTPEANKKVGRLDEVADKINPLLRQEPINLEELEEAILCAVRICHGDAEVSRLKKSIDSAKETGK